MNKMRIHGQWLDPWEVKCLENIAYWNLWSSLGANKRKSWRPELVGDHYWRSIWRRYSAAAFVELKSCWSWSWRFLWNTLLKSINFTFIWAGYCTHLIEKHWLTLELILNTIMYYWKSSWGDLGDHLGDMKSSGYTFMIRQGCHWWCDVETKWRHCWRLSGLVKEDIGSREE